MEMSFAFTRAPEEIGAGDAVARFRSLPSELLKSFVIRGQE
jgi:hypothetical protein